MYILYSRSFFNWFFMCQYTD